jgi:uncharacterized membrane protein YgdD (TMEM256/DUF423 family)
MPASARLFMAAGAVSAGLAVACGALGAHALRQRLGIEMLTTWHIAVGYHLFHSLGLLVIGLIAVRLDRSWTLQGAGLAMATGVVLFSGSLYALALSGERMLGMLTPLGGLLMITSWALLVVAVARGK